MQTSIFKARPHAQLDNNLTTLKEFLAQKAKARQGNTISHINILPNAAAHAENSRREDDRGKEKSGEQSVTQN